MRHATSLLDRAAATDQLLGHLTQTFHCREIYWSAIALSRNKMEQLCVIVDGYDKSKLEVDVPPKGGMFDKHQRTGIQLSATLAHGWGCCVFLTAEHSSVGGSFTWESLLYTSLHHQSLLE